MTDSMLKPGEPAGNLNPDELDTEDDLTQAAFLLPPGSADELQGVHARLFRVEERLDGLRRDWIAERSKPNANPDALAELEAAAARITPERDRLLELAAYRDAHPTFNPNPDNPTQRLAEVRRWRGLIADWLSRRRTKADRPMRTYLTAYDENLATYERHLVTLIRSGGVHELD